jgi:hypothetical protein
VPQLVDQRGLDEAWARLPVVWARTLGMCVAQMGTSLSCKVQQQSLRYLQQKKGRVGRSEEP